LDPDHIKTSKRFGPFVRCTAGVLNALRLSRTLGIWLNGYVNGARGMTLIAPLGANHVDLVTYCQSHMDTPVLDAAGNVFGAEK
jgi:hypothetical protein